MRYEPRDLVGRVICFWNQDIVAAASESAVVMVVQPGAQRTPFSVVFGEGLSIARNGEIGDFSRVRKKPGKNARMNMARNARLRSGDWVSVEGIREIRMDGDVLCPTS